MFTGENATNHKSYAKIINEFHLNRVSGYLDNHGGKLVCGGIEKDGKRIMPTVILNPLKSSDLYNNEVFGPIMKVNTFRNIDEVINEINEREKPLVIYYFGRIGRLWSKTNENKEKLRN